MFLPTPYGGASIEWVKTNPMYIWYMLRSLGHERMPGMADRADLAYTEAVLHESMRMASVLPIGVGHKTTCDTELGLYLT